MTNQPTPQPAMTTTDTEAACHPTTVYAGDVLCLELECDHTGGGGSVSIPPDSYCDEIREETVCGTHSTFAIGDFDFEELVHAEPWPCRHTPTPAR